MHVDDINNSGYIIGVKLANFEHRGNFEQRGKFGIDDLKPSTDRMRKLYPTKRETYTTDMHTNRSRLRGSIHTEEEYLLSLLDYMLFISESPSKQDSQTLLMMGKNRHV